MVKDTVLARMSDAQLLEGHAKKGGREFVREVFRRYGHQIYGNCLKYLESEKLSEEAAKSVIAELPALMMAPGQVPLRERVYLHIREHCLRKVKTLGLPDSEGNGLDLKDIEETERLEQEVAKLNRTERQCVELHLLEGKPLKEVSEITGFTVERVKEEVEKGRRSLKKRLEDK